MTVRLHAVGRRVRGPCIEGEVEDGGAGNNVVVGNLGWVASGRDEDVRDTHESHGDGGHVVLVKLDGG